MEFKKASWTTKNDQIQLNVKYLQNTSKMPKEHIYERTRSRTISTCF